MFVLLSRFHLKEAAASLSHPAQKTEDTGDDQSLVHIPDLREQRGKLFVLQAQCKHLLSMDAAQCPEVHQFH